MIWDEEESDIATYKCNTNAFMGNLEIMIGKHGVGVDSFDDSMYDPNIVPLSLHEEWFLSFSEIVELDDEYKENHEPTFFYNS